MRKLVTKLLSVMLFGSLMLMWPSSTLALSPQDYLGIHILDPPDPRAPGDPDGCIPMGRNVCVDIGPAYGAGISDAGDVFGSFESNHPHVDHFEEGIRWLRRDGYKGDNMGKYPLDPSWTNEIDGSPIPFNRAYGVRTTWVSPGGYASGNGVPGLFHVDIPLGKYTVLGDGVGEKPSGNRALGREVSPTRRAVHYNRVSNASLVEPPFTLEKTGLVTRLGDGFQVKALNSNDVIVGFYDPSCLGDEPPWNLFCFGESSPMKLEPGGPDQWSARIPMEQLGSINQAKALDLSNTDPAYAIGSSAGDTPIQNGVVWNVSTGKIIANLGENNIPHRINSTGDMAVGTRKESFLTPKEPVVWWTNNGWETFEVLTIQEILDVVPGGEHWAEVSILTNNLGPEGLDSPQAINKHGQILAIGKLFAEAPIEKLTEWPREFATGDDCADPADYPCGIPFILETRPFILDLLGDVNFDTVLNNLDITPMIHALTVGSAVDDEEQLIAFHTVIRDGRFPNADMNGDGRVDNLDITGFVDALVAAAGTAQSAGIPEPSTLALLLGLILSASAASRKSQSKNR